MVFSARVEEMPKRHKSFVRTGVGLSWREVAFARSWCTGRNDLEKKVLELGNAGRGDVGGRESPSAGNLRRWRS